MDTLSEGLDQVIATADEFALEAKYAAALHYYRRALEEKSTADLQARIAFVLMLKGDFEASKRHLDRTVEMNPNHIAANILLAKWHIEQKHPHLSLECVRILEEHPKNHAAAAVIVSEALYALGDNEKAELSYRRSLALLEKSAAQVLPPLQSTHAFVSDFMLVYYLTHGKLTTARNSWTVMYSYIHYRIGYLCHSIGRLNEAEAEFRTSLELDGTNSQPKFALADLLTDTHRYEEALLLYKELETISSDRARACEGLAKVSMLQATQLEQKAIQHFHKALVNSSHVNSAEIYSHLGSVYYDAAQYEDAQACFQKALQIQPENSTASLGLGYICTLRNQPRIAISLLQVTALEDRHLHLKHCHLAECYLKIGNQEEAIKCLRQSLLIYPEDVATLVQLGTLHTLRQETDLALACYKKALSISPGCPQVYKQLKKHNEPNGSSCNIM